LPEPSIQNLLVVGIDTVSIANSAKKAGYKIYAADYFGDMDLRCVCSGFKAIIKQKRGKSCGRMESKFKPEAFLKIANSISEKYKIDAILLSSGLDDDFNILYELNDLAPILGNSPRVIERVRKKPRFFKELKRLGIAHPETAIVKDIDEAKSSAARIGYPVVVKPVRGFGGDSIRTARNFKELERAFKISFVSEEILVQKFINGLHASISLLATTKDVKTLTINEQLLGLHFLFQQEPFGYCGNIVPLYVADSIFKRCKHITEKIASHFGLQGSNGIDLVISKEGTPYVVEVNPRLQGTLECVERVIGINLVKSHVNACLHGSLPTIKERTSTFCTRLILYSPKRIIAPDLVAFREVRDVPLPECIIEKGEPICSIITEGKNRNFSFQKARKLVKSIYNMVHSA
jgi:hypothetical protein